MQMPFSLLPKQLPDKDVRVTLLLVYTNVPV